MSRKRKTQRATRPARTSLSARDKLPFIEHLVELRRRLFTVAVSVLAGSMIAYGIQQSIIAVLLRPSDGQHFIYTSPLGGINFLFSVCLYVGIGVSIPLIIYHFLRFLQPLMRATTLRFIVTCSLISGVVALAGITFGYFIGLPAALHFLLHQFKSAQIRPLVTIQSYMSFVGMYLLGSALMFQLPLILIIINRIKPLKPWRLLHFERHVIVFAFITAFIMNPTPNILDQMIVVVPIILMYQVGIVLIWFLNRDSRHAKFKHLFDQDDALRAERAKRARLLQPLFQEIGLPSLLPEPVAIPVSTSNAEAVLAAEQEDPNTSESSPTLHQNKNFHAVRRTNYQRYTPRLIQ